MNIYCKCIFFTDPLCEFYVRPHLDQDITYQWAVFLGDFTGAMLRLYGKDKRPMSEVELHPNLVLKFDGRLLHELVLNNFTGVRYALFFYKRYDRRMTRKSALMCDPVWFICNEAE